MLGIAIAAGWLAAWLRLKNGEHATRRHAAKAD